MAAINAKPTRVTSQSWGQYAIWKEAPGCMIRSLYIDAGHRLRYQSHIQCDKMWTVLHGDGELLLNGVTTRIAAGDIVEVRAGQRKRLIAGTHGIRILEVQIGQCSDSDILFHEDIDPRPVPRGVDVN